MKTENVEKSLADLKHVLQSRFGDEIEIILFGSAARGTCGPESDIDILIVIPGKVNSVIEEEIISASYDIELMHDVVFGIIVYSAEFWYSPAAEVMPLHKNITYEGIVL